MYTTLGNLIRSARHQRGLTLEDLARQVGVTPGALSHIESGRRLPSPSNAVAIAGALGVPREEILRALDEEHSDRRRSSLDRDERTPKARSGWTPDAHVAFSEQPIEALFEQAAPAPSRSQKGASYQPMRAASVRDMARWSNDTTQRIEALDQLADSAAEAIRTLRGLVNDEDPSVSREARRLLRELDVRIPEE